jgi:hypothetical protein
MDGSLLCSLAYLAFYSLGRDESGRTWGHSVYLSRLGAKSHAGIATKALLFMGSDTRRRSGDPARLV